MQKPTEQGMELVYIPPTDMREAPKLFHLLTVPYVLETLQAFYRQQHRLNRPVTIGEVRESLHDLFTENPTTNVPCVLCLTRLVESGMLKEDGDGYILNPCMSLTASRLLAMLFPPENYLAPFIEF